jgi:hypothetical protein
VIQSSTKNAQIPPSPIRAYSQSPIPGALAFATHPIAVVTMANRMRVVRISAVRRMGENVAPPHRSVDSRQDRKRGLRAGSTLNPLADTRICLTPASGPDFATEGLFA